MMIKVKAALLTVLTLGALAAHAWGILRWPEYGQVAGVISAGIVATAITVVTWMAFCQWLEERR